MATAVNYQQLLFTISAILLLLVGNLIQLKIGGIGIYGDAPRLIMKLHVEKLAGIWMSILQEQSPEHCPMVGSLVLQLPPSVSTHLQMRPGNRLYPVSRFVLVLGSQIIS